MTRSQILERYLFLCLPPDLQQKLVADLAALNRGPRKEKAPPIYFNEKDLRWENIPATMRLLWTISCPAVNVEQELAAAAAWMVANPKKAPKSNYARFLNGWMSSQQQRGGTRGFVQSQQSDRGAEEWANKT